MAIWWQPEHLRSTGGRNRGARWESRGAPRAEEEKKGNSENKLKPTPRTWPGAGDRGGNGVSGRDDQKPTAGRGARSRTGLTPPGAAWLFPAYGTSLMLSTGAPSRCLGTKPA